MWQAGSRQKRSPADQTFLLRNAVNHSVYLNKPLFLTLYDFRQCFDKVWLEDSLLSLCIRRVFDIYYFSFNYWSRAELRNYYYISAFYIWESFILLLGIE